MKCIKCGAENNQEARFCKACGEVLPSRAMTLIPDFSDKILPDRYIIQERFKVLKKLGKGGMGEVLLAEDVKLKRKVAIKSILLKDKIGLTDTTSKLRFLREAQTASQLDHPNICTIYEIYEESDRDYIVMQYIDGVTLDQIIGVKKLSVDKILDISIQVCDGIREAHSHDIIHRDVKPGNIMVDKKGIVRILDFGLAKFSDDSLVKDGDRVDSNLTEKGFVMGTIAYISPEQARGKSLDRQTDIFSFGIVLYEMIEGKNPFREDEQIETLYNVLKKDIEFTRDIPEELQQIAGRALERDKAKRYPDFSLLKQDLEAFRTLYQQGKKEKIEAVGTKTEIIKYEEQAKLLEEVQKTSDKEDLGDLVYRIKRFKASTERVPAATGKGKPKLQWMLLALAAVLVVVTAAFLLFKPPPPPVETFYIYLHPFEINTIDKIDKFLPEMLDYLLYESLNQFDEFKTINKDTALYIAGKGDQDIDLELLKNKFNLAYELTGKLEKSGKGYSIKAFLKSTGEDENTRSIPAPGLIRDKLLETQVDMIVDSVYNYLSPGRAKKAEIKEVKEIFGNDWEKFSNFYAGFLFHKRLEYIKAEKYFLMSRDLLIARYYLADVYHFNGERNKALKLIKNEIIPEINKLTPWLRLKTKALEARLKFQFHQEIKNRDQLITAYPFSKEVFYEMGEAYFHHAAPGKAVVYYKKALELDKNYSNALNHLGYCYAYIGDHRNAITSLAEYQRLDNTPNSYDSLGDGYFYAGKLKFAEDMKRNAIGQSEEEIPWWSYQTLADIYILKSEYDKAHESLTRYRKLQKSQKAEATVLAKQAFIKYKDQNYNNALELINQSLDRYDSDSINEDSAEAHWLRGLVLLALDKVKESKDDLKWLKKFENKYRLDWNNFKAAYKYFIHLEALILEKENRLPEAESHFKTLIDMKDKLSYWSTYYHYQFFHTQYAQFLTRNQRYREALSEVNKCLEFNDVKGDYIPALWQKAEILEKQNNPEEARPIYEKIAELYGESRENNFFRHLLKTKLNPD
jgi:tetratricopeptide (TPR) repeat protein